MPNKYFRNTPVLPVFFIAIDLLVIFLVFLFHFLLSKGMYTDFFERFLSPTLLQSDSTAD